MSLTIYKEIKNNIDILATIYKSGTRTKDTTSKAYYLNKLTNLESVVEAKAKTEFAIQEADTIEKETLFIAKTPTITNNSRKHCNREGELDNRANAGRSATGDKTIDNTQIFEDAASYQMSDNNNSSVDSIQAEKQDSRTYHFTYRIVTVKISLHKSRLSI